jgi:signal transduction histidine kinase
MGIPSSDGPDRSTPLPQRPAISLTAALRQRLFPRSEKIIQWAAYAILFAVTIFYILDRPDTSDRPRFYGVIFSLALLLLLNMFSDAVVRLFSTEERGQLVFLFGSAALILIATWAGIRYIGIYLVLMLAAQISIILPGFRQGLTFIAALTAAYLAVLWLAGTPPEGILSAVLSLLTGLVFVITIGRVLVMYTQQAARLEQALADLRTANQALIEARQKEQDLAVAQERVRMAREIHDGLGHHLTALSIQLQAAGKLLSTQPEKAAASIALCRDEAQAALREVRQSVAALRQSPLDLNNISEEIANLVAGFERSAGLPASLVISGEPGEVSPAAAQTLYRAVQEGLTNTQKHAQGATRVLVDLCWNPGEPGKPGEARLVIEDDGQPGTAGRGEAGYGLAGIYERVQLLNGTAASGPLEGGGFRIQVSIPTGEQL